MEPTIVEVTIKLSPADEWSPEGWVVRPMWSGVDRPEGTGYLVRRLELARRLQRAMLDGAVFSEIEIRTDVHGKTYVATKSAVLGRHMNADLRRLGY